MTSHIPKLSEQAKLRKNIITGVESLPALPVFLERIIECANNDTSSARDLKDLVLQDQSITARVLRLANSAYYGAYRQVNTVTDAIVVVGFQAVVDLATSLALKRMFEQVKTSDEFDMQQFWMHSLGSAEAARLTAGKAGYRNLELAYLLGLLHDLGKVVLALIFRKEFEDAVFESRANNEPLHLVEQSLFEFHHGEAGAWLGEKWQLPASLIAGMRFHHDLAHIPALHQGDAFIAACGNWFAHRLRFGSSGNAVPQRVNLEEIPGLRIPPVNVAAIEADLEQSRVKLETVIELLDE